MCRQCHNEKHHICFSPERMRNSRLTSKTHSANLETVYEDNEPSSGSEAEDDKIDQNVDNSERFDQPLTKTTGPYAIHSNKENGTHRTTLLECVMVTVGHSTDKSKQYDNRSVTQSASERTYFKQPVCEKLHLPKLGPTKLSVATFLSTDEIPVDTFISQF